MAKTMTINQLIAGLREMKKQHGGTSKVFLSRDEEGNGFGTITPENSFGYDDEAKVLILYPSEERVDYFED